jgi:hypothetical protein
MRGAGPREGSVLSQMLGSNFQNFDFYPNWQNILGKDFISPIAEGGRLTYDYELQDSVFVGKEWCYKIALSPKRPHDLAFKGTVWITADKYALRRIDVVASEQSNINFVSDLRIYQDLTPPTDGPGLAARTRLVMGIRPYEKQAALRVRFTTVNSNFVRNQPHEASFYDHYGAGQGQRNRWAADRNAAGRRHRRLLRQKPPRHAEPERAADFRSARLGPRPALGAQHARLD